MKTCSKCKLSLSLDKFSNNKTKKDGKQTYCKECKRKRDKYLYDENKDLYIQRSKETRYKIRKYINNIKLTNGCCKCGYNKCPAALHFHHKNNDKEFSIANAAKFGFNQIKKEINKCDILCANCHAEKHWPLV